jgi:hypothetical protein
MNAAFDPSGRPVAITDFQLPYEPDEEATRIDEVRREALQTIRHVLEHEYRWAAQGRTLKTRLLRFDLIKNETDIAASARRHSVGEHAVRKQRRALLQLRNRLFSEGENHRTPP